MFFIFLNKTVIFINKFLFIGGVMVFVTMSKYKKLFNNYIQIKI